MNMVGDIARRVSHQTVAGRAIRLPLRLIPRNLAIPIFGGINRGMWWVTGAGPTNACWIGSYEEGHFSALREIVRPGMIAYDVGANTGYYTLALSRLVGDAGRVYAFEPGARNSYFLSRHLELNRIRNVTIVQAVVGASIGLVPFTGWRIADRGAYLVPSISLDDFIVANPPPSFIKMDIEGAEGAALDGARTLLSRAQPAWLLATHSDELTASCRSVLAQSGYRFTAFDRVSDPGNSADFLALAGAN